MYTNKSEIVYLSIADTVTYDGEAIILPFNGSIFDQHWMIDNKISISEKITPVFLAMHLGRNYKEEYLNEYNIQYLKRYEPIGCRDTEARRVLQKYGIKAYLNGCLTALLPKIENRADNGKVYLIDAPIELQKYMPKDYLENCEIVKQQFYFERVMSPDELDRFVMEHYKKMQDAHLIITSRLHVAVPCMAWGIPVIFAKKVIDSRFGWLDKYIPLYDYEQFASIDWKPQNVLYEEAKHEILERNKQRLMAEMYKGKIAEEMNSYYTQEEKVYPNFAEYISKNWTGVKEFIKKEWDINKNLSYAIWGLIATAGELISFIETNYPNAKLKKVIDNYKTGEYHNIEISNSASLKKGEVDYLLVLSVSASNDALTLVNELGLEEKEYYLVGEQFISVTKEDV